jgi:V/A-type H+/Na+-transporting ATPase subunit E
MPEEIRDLIEKINQEGIKAAGEKANSIEAEAQQKAAAIISQARIEADRIISDAKDRISLEDVRERALLAQAGRDLLLSLRKDINAMLGLIMVSDIRQALTPEALFRLLIEVVRNYNSAERSEITVSLNKKDLELLEKHYLDKLKQETEGDIVLKPGEEIRGGFTISFDRGKSCYDFTDKALAEYIGTYLKPKLNKILQEAVEE